MGWLFTSSFFVYCYKLFQPQNHLSPHSADATGSTKAAKQVQEVVVGSCWFTIPFQCQRYYNFLVLPFVYEPGLQHVLDTLGNDNEKIINYLL